MDRIDVMDRCLNRDDANSGECFSWSCHISTNKAESSLLRSSAGSVPAAEGRTCSCAFSGNKFKQQANTTPPVRHSEIFFDSTLFSIGIGIINPCYRVYRPSLAVRPVVAPSL